MFSQRERARALSARVTDSSTPVASSSSSSRSVVSLSSPTGISSELSWPETMGIKAATSSLSASSSAAASSTEAASIRRITARSSKKSFLRLWDVAKRTIDQLSSM